MAQIAFILAVVAVIVALIASIIPVLVTVVSAIISPLGVAVPQLVSLINLISGFFKQGLQLFNWFLPDWFLPYFPSLLIVLIFSKYIIKLGLFLYRVTMKLFEKFM